MSGVRRSRLPATVFVILSGLYASCSGDADPAPADRRRPTREADAGTLDSGAGAADTGAPERAGVTWFVAPDGDDSAPGTREQPTTLTAALERVRPGGTVYLRGGTYKYATQITIPRDDDGAPNAERTLSQYQHEAPILDFSDQPYGTESRPHGLQIEGDHWHVIGLIVRGAAGSGIYVAGSHNTIQRCATYANRGTGLQIGRVASVPPAEAPSHNLILNCESFDNYDRPPRASDPADGFAARRGIGAGNVFRGCVAHHNIDDGWDLSAATDDAASGALWIDQCVAHTNGLLLDGTHDDAGDREGFKLGGGGIAVGHVVTRSVAYYNGKHGFTSNTNPGELRLSNDLAFDNGEGNYAFGDHSAVAAAVFANNVSLWVETGAARADEVAGEDASGSNRFWRDGSSGVAASDFATTLRLPKLARDAAGNLDLSVFALAPESPLIDAGVVPAQLPFDAAYYRGKPDLGAFETR